MMDGDKKVKIRQLKIGASDGENTVVTEGLAVGDRVVLEGTDRLKDGSDVEVVNDRRKCRPVRVATCRANPRKTSTTEPAPADKAKKGGA
jgi:multidrug efflux system membrane fusion protein